MFVRITAYLVLAQVFLSGVFLREPVFGQRPAPDFPASTTNTTGLTKPSDNNSSVDLDIYLRESDTAGVEELAALTLVTLDGQLYRQGTTRNGHLRWNEVVPMQYRIQVVVPGFDPAFQEIDAQGTGEVSVTVQLRPQTGRGGAYPPVSTDPEVDYVYGLYASRLGDWEEAKSYWGKVLQLRPDHVPAMVSISEALLNDNKASEAVEYLERAAKTDPSYWRTEAVFAELSLRGGSTSDAVRHARRAIELGQNEAASASPLLARALVAEATEVLRAYLKEHPGDVAAKKQFEGLNPAFGNRDTDTAAAKSVSSSRNSRWLPPTVDENVPPVEPGPACDLEEVLQGAGQRIQEFVTNVERFTATESLVHEAINKSGQVYGSEKRKYDYLVSIEETRPGFLNVEEYQRSGSTYVDSPGGMKTKGLPALVLIFHPYYSGTFSMRCEGLATLNGKRAWQVYFVQRNDKPNKIRSYRVATGGPNYPVALKGRAWIAADSHQILGLQTDLIDTIPEIGLTAEHTVIEYGPVHFSRGGMDMWLPQTAEVYIELKRNRIHRRMSFSNYMLFAVEEKQQISSPKTNP